MCYTGKPIEYKNFKKILFFHFFIYCLLKFQSKTFLDSICNMQLIGMAKLARPMGTRPNLTLMGGKTRPVK